MRRDAHSRYFMAWQASVYASGNWAHQWRSLSGRKQSCDDRRRQSVGWSMLRRFPVTAGAKTAASEGLMRTPRASPVPRVCEHVASKGRCGPHRAAPPVMLSFRSEAAAAESGGDSRETCAEAPAVRCCRPASTSILPQRQSSRGRSGREWTGQARRGSTESGDAPLAGSLVLGRDVTPPSHAACETRPRGHASVLRYCSRPVKLATVIVLPSCCLGKW